MESDLLTRPHAQNVSTLGESCLTLCRTHQNGDRSSKSLPKSPLSRCT
jgi:hypothetical protein